MKRKFWSALLLASGCASLAYGWLFHVITVEVDKERQISIAVPDISESPSVDGSDNANAPDDSDPFHGQSGGGNEGNPFAPPPTFMNPPGMKMENVTEKYQEDLILPEYEIVQDVTVGGIARLESGKLKRTYYGDAPPSLCPS